MNNFLTIVLTALGSSGLFSFIIFLITRKDNKEKELKEMNKQLKAINDEQKAIELDNCRIQLLIMLYHNPDESMEILKIAHRYFVELNGDWYMTSMFNRWLEVNGIGKPDWFDSNG